MVNEKDYLLTNQEILGGLKAAIARGEELKDAMMTFYQAGYDKTEIEEAAKSYIEMLNPITAQNQMPLSKAERKARDKAEKERRKAEEKARKSKQGENSKNSNAVYPTPQPMGAAGQKKSLQETEQKVSKYVAPKEKPSKPPGGKAITIVLILVLLLLLGILTSVILFREELIGFFNGLFA